MDTRIATKNYRLSQWAGIIRDCNQSGLKVDDYCETHGITHHQYYYWLKKVKEAALTVDRTEVFVDVTDFVNEEPVHTDASAMIMINGHELKISDNASKAFIKNLLGALADA